MPSNTFTEPLHNILKRNVINYILISICLYVKQCSLYVLLEGTVSIHRYPFAPYQVPKQPVHTSIFMTCRPIPFPQVRPTCTCMYNIYSCVAYKVKEVVSSWEARSINYWAWCIKECSLKLQTTHELL